jgi:hypothetical protein
LHPNHTLAAAFTPSETDVRALKLVLVLKRELEWLNQKDADGNTPLHLAAMCGNKRFLASLLTPIKLSTQRKEEGRIRMKTFLLVNYRLGKIFPHDIVHYILGFMRVDFKETPRERLFKTCYPDNNILMLDYFDDCFEELPSLLSSEQTAKLIDIVNIRNNEQKTAAELATDPRIKHLLDPKIWQQKV